MKKVFYLILTVLSINVGVNAQNVNLPDVNFKAALVANSSINTNNDSEIQVSEANSYTGSIVLSGLPAVADLTGLEEFTLLTELQMFAGALSTIDLSQNTNLETLHLYGYGNQAVIPLSLIDLTNNTLLISLSLQMTSITNLDLSSNTQLNFLNLTGSLISSLNVSNCPLLSVATVYDTQLTTLDLSGNPALTTLNCSNNFLTSLDLSLNSNLTDVDCSNNQLTSLDITNGNNSILVPGVFHTTNNPNLTCISVSDVAWCVANLSNTQFNTPIDTWTNFSFDCNQCYVNIPDVNFKNYLLSNSNINLNGDNEIECAEASIATAISCIGQNISDLTGVEAFTNITTLRCGSNQLSSIDVSMNTALTWLECNDNQLTQLDLSTNTYLNNLHCGYNSITSIDVSLNNGLTTFQCNDNLLSFLNLANGANTLINNNNFYAINNPNLTCIQVDDVNYSASNWTYVDAQVNFSTLCQSSVLVASIDVQGQGGVSTIIMNGGTLQMEATVFPLNADDATYTWSIVNGTGSATIDGAGLMSALTDGTVEVIATANDASGISGSSIITITNQTAGLIETSMQKLNVFPNPVQDQLNIDFGDIQPSQVVILDYSGRVVKSMMNNVKTIDTSELIKGIYMVKVSTENGTFTKRFVKS